MIKHFFLFSLSTSLLLMALQMSAQEQRQEAEELIENLITENNVAGVAAGVSVKGMNWQSSKGYSNMTDQIPFEVSTIVRIASISKPMTALAIMQLFEKGLVDIDAPIQKYLPDYPRHPKTQITTRHLLSHTSGISGYKNGKEAETKIEYAGLSEAVDVFKNRDLLFEPGTKYSYTTYGYVVLGLIIEKVSGLTFQDYMKQNIWDKANMTNTGVDKFGVSVKGQSNLYRRSNKGKIKPSEENNLSNRIPGGGFYSTLEDMLKFGQGILNDQFVKRSTLDLMREHHSLEKESNGYGFGWFLYNPKPNEGAIIGHSGEQSGASAQLFIIPDTETIVIVLSNTSLASKEVSTAAGQLLGLSQKWSFSE